MALPVEAPLTETISSGLLPGDSPPKIAWIVKRVVHQIRCDNCVDLAAQMSFFFIFALFAFFIVFGALAGVLPFAGFSLRVFDWIAGYFPAEANQLVLNMIAGISSGHVALLSIGFVTALWAATSGVVSLMETLNRVYEVPENRGFWRGRLLAIGVLLVTAGLFFASFGLMTLGHAAGAWLVVRLPLGAAFPTIYEVARWIFLAGVLGLSVAFIDNLLPNRRRPWRWVTPGGAAATVVLALETSGINIYVHLARYNQYGTLGAFFVIMIWIYVAGFVLLAGAEINSVLEKVRVLKAGA